ncbi:MAG: hypothetical protein HeimC2_15840 [Candidatus Heimdallarchaeota archaeon LC_2]|nr:MAG: hypothetical protein HeimC2_15840 [Candidatus Heimdallarchaeota archaeon LC_2]
MGSDTLVDLVAKIWILPGTVADKVKSVAQDAWNGIKAVGQFIIDTVIKAILDSIVLIFHKFISAMSAIFLELDPTVQITSLQDGVRIGDDELRIFRNNLGLTLFFGSNSITISNVMTLAKIVFRHYNGSNI